MTTNGIARVVHSHSGPGAAAGAVAVRSLATIPPPPRPASHGADGPRLVVSADRLQVRGRTLEVVAGTEVIWVGPDFDSLWFPAGARPRVVRRGTWRVTVFDTPGRYLGRFTVAGTRLPHEVPAVTVVVREQEERPWVA